jgi:Icc-related predicted phosphoesterase
MMKIVHISDTHGYHNDLILPEADVIVHTGDIGGRTDILELTSFLMWFEKQPAKKKIFIGGNHDLCLDKNEPEKARRNGNMFGWSRAVDHYKQAMELIPNYDVKYLCDKEYVFEGVKFYGSPYSPSFHRDSWAFNADRGAEINKIWAKIPSDVNVLLTHTPMYGILDNLKEYTREGEDPHAGCNELLRVVKKRLFNLQLHCCGHIHDNYGAYQVRISNSRRLLCSNGAMFTNGGEVLYTQPPLIITI